ncbi:uncharacterized protein LOC129612940 [Condylostylus longicornis]|uniref:uncharacterized protein LOC129612940 n=1 Tax=Condylostylus longicornis TaxID=2530218 RepID=UPI00244DE4BC|nr:uncharacterized protein LOC129612940 [Condylostylus longicornis]XP_055382770.1 uncharacterized protein LOC129612940 [Condylostylus longicornis]
MSKLFMTLILQWLVMLLIEYQFIAFGQETNHNIPEKIVREATEGDNIIITCSFSLVDFKGENNPNKNNVTDANIYWIYPNDQFTKINESRIKEEKLLYHDTINSILTISSSKSETDEGYYTCLLYQDRVFLSQKQIYINFTKNIVNGIKDSTIHPISFDSSNNNETGSPSINSTNSKVNTRPTYTVSNDTEPNYNATIISILVSGIIILLIILAIVLYLFYKRRRERCPATNNAYARYDRNNSVNSTIELTPYNPAPIG